MALMVEVADDAAPATKVTVSEMLIIGLLKEMVLTSALVVFIVQTDIPAESEIEQLLRVFPVPEEAKIGVTAAIGFEYTSFRVMVTVAKSVLSAV